jgi:diphosphomevalonate decarboxylase
MRRTRDTSPYHEAWIRTCRQDLPRAVDAIRQRDIGALGSVAETSCMRMHASCMAADPPIVYLAPATLAVIERVILLRSEGVHCFFTVDAGPQVKVVSNREDVERVRDGIGSVPGVLSVLVHEPGPGSLTVS